jgi:hypothetical protein
MPVRTITIRVTGDVAQFERSMKSVGAQIVKVEQQTRSTTVVFERMRGGLVQLAQQGIGRAIPGMEGLASSMAALGLSAGSVAGGLLAVGGIAWAFRKIGEDAANTKAIIDELEKVAFARGPRAILEDQQLRVQTQLDRARESLRIAQTGVRTFGSQAVPNPIAIANAEREVNRLEKILDGLAIKMKLLDDAAVKPFKNMESEAEKARKEMERLEKAAADLLRTVQFPTLTPEETRIGQLLGPALVPISRTVTVTPRDEERMRQLASTAESMATSVAIAFEAWVTGAEKAKFAVRDMVNSILRDLLRLVAQRAIVEPLAGVFLNAIGGSSVAGGGSRAVVVNQSVNFAISAVDAPGVASLLQQNSGTIAQIVGDAARRSTGFRAQLIGG